MSLQSPPCLCSGPACCDRAVPGPLRSGPPAHMRSHRGWPPQATPSCCGVGRASEMHILRPLRGGPGGSQSENWPQKILRSATLFPTHFF